MLREVNSMALEYPRLPELEKQLTELVTVQMLDPIELWLDDQTHLTQLRERSLAHAESWARRLLSSSQTEAVHAIVQIIAMFYPDDVAFTPRLSWWGTPVGRITAIRFGHPGATAVSYTTAGAMLGISRQGVHDLVKRGKLSLHPDGGVSTTAIRDRLSAILEFSHQEH